MTSFLHSLFIVLQWRKASSPNYPRNGTKDSMIPLHPLGQQREESHFNHLSWEWYNYRHIESPASPSTTEESHFNQLSQGLHKGQNDTPVSLRIMEESHPIVVTWERFKKTY